MMPPHVLIRYDRCELTLKLPVYFEKATLGQIRKVFKLLEGRPYQNDAAHETLDEFFPAWEQDLKNRIDRAGAELTDAKVDAENKRRIMAAFGSAMDEMLAHEKRVFQRARRIKKSDPERFEKCRAHYERVTRPKTDHLQAVKDLKSATARAKHAKAAVERCGVIYDAYKAIKAQQ